MTEYEEPGHRKPPGTAVPDSLSGQAQPPLSEAERVELEQLRREVARLRALPRGRGRRAGRWVCAVALLVVGLMLGGCSIAAVFLRNQVLDTDRYVATVAPLARDPVVQDAIADRLSNEVLIRVDLETLAREASAWLREQGAPAQIEALVGPAVNGVESFVREQVRRLVATEQFAEAWDAANRVAHRSLVAVVTGSAAGAVTSTGDTVSIDLGVVLDSVKQRLTEAGFALAAKIPHLSVQFTLFQSAELPKIRTAVRWLDRLATWLPWLTLAVLIAAVLVAPDHRRGTVVAGLFLAVGLLALRLVLAVLRDFYLDRLPPGVQSPEAVGRILQTILRDVREAVALLVVVALLVAAAAYLAGPGRLATGLRRLASLGIDALAGVLGRSGIPFGPVPAVTARYQRAAGPAAVLIAVVILLLNPAVASALWLSAGVLVVLAAVKILARISPAQGQPGPAPSAPSGRSPG